MPVPTTTSSNGQSASSQGKNIWLAAGEGDLDRVKQLVDEQGISPTAADEFTYTPLHAAASYGHLDILRFLLTHPSAPSDAANTTDSDGDTPLFVCETVAVARLLVEQHAADPRWKNHEGKTAAVLAYENEHFDLATYLRSLTGEAEPSGSASPSPSSSDDEDNDGPLHSNVASSPSRATTTATRPGPTATSAQEQEVDALAEAQTEALMEKVGEILERHERAGTDPEDELRQVVGEVVVRQIMEGMEGSVSG